MNRYGKTKRIDTKSERGREISLSECLIFD